MYIDKKLLKNDEETVYKLRKLYQSYGYNRYKMSKFEEYDLYVKNKDFLISDGVITFTDTSGRLLALKPDVTLSIINNCKDTKDEVHKVYYNENVYRISGSSNTYKEIMQTGLECIGALGTFEICEVICLALKSLSIIDKDYVMQISHIGLLNSVLDELCIFDDDKKEILLLISSKNDDGIKSFCEQKGFDCSVAQKLMLFTKNYSDVKDAVDTLKEVANGKQLEEFEKILNVLVDCGYEDKFTVDFSVVGGMRYYSGVVFKGYINSIPTSVCSGGQYDKLMKKMGRSSSAIGFAVYLDELNRFKGDINEYDVDIVLIDNGNVSEVLKTSRRLSENGESVRVCKNIPKDIRFKKAVAIKDGEVEVISENA
ncbi:MAG: ATP phosphoribosyltransferase regulatory subunit [Acutalibacteraceae bacterium]|nr:ATP phosphoribosyltransferase regulatory subunit [Acutalibacteraceae bacterium]